MEDERGAGSGHSRPEGLWRFTAKEERRWAWKGTARNSGKSHRYVNALDAPEVEASPKGETFKANCISG